LPQHLICCHCGRGCQCSVSSHHLRCGTQCALNDTMVSSSMAVSWEDETWNFLRLVLCLTLCRPIDTDYKWQHSFTILALKFRCWTEIGYPNISNMTHLSRLFIATQVNDNCRGLGLPPGWVYHRVLLCMRDLLIYHGVLSLRVECETWVWYHKKCHPMPWPIKKGTYAFIVFRLFFVLMTRSCSSEFVVQFFLYDNGCWRNVFKFKHRDTILKDNE